MWRASIANPVVSQRDPDDVNVAYEAELYGRLHLVCLRCASSGIEVGHESFANPACKADVMLRDVFVFQSAAVWCQGFVHVAVTPLRQARGQAPVVQVLFTVAYCCLASP